MKSEMKFELWRWGYFVILFLLTGLIGILLIGLFLAVPFLLWLFHDIPYALPTWDRIGRVSLLVLFIGLFAGTVTWYHEKRSTGR
jgi:hypothetical protein